MRRPLAILVLATLGACSIGPDHAPATVEHPYDFFGIVASVKIEDTYSTRPPGWSAGEPGGGSMRVGPAWLELSDGMRLRVPADTPGANGCEEFYDPHAMNLGVGEEVASWSELEGAPKPERCVVIGELQDGGAEDTILWFQVLPEYDPIRGTVTVGGAVSTTESTALSGDGYRFPVSADLTFNCRSDVRSLEDAVELARFHELQVDASTGRIVGVVCHSLE